MVGFKSKFSEQIGVGVAKLATENRRCSVVLESLSHNGKPPLPGLDALRRDADICTQAKGPEVRFEERPSNLKGIRVEFE